MILDGEDYREKMQHPLLSDGSHWKLKQDPTKKIERRINYGLKKNQSEIAEQHQS